jgi:hypothetical protein
MIRNPIRACSILAGALVLAAVPARGDDAPARTRIDLSGFAASAAATGPRIRVAGDAGYSWLNTDEEDPPSGAFQPAPFADTALSPELFDDLLRRVVSETAFPGVGRQLSGRSLDVWGPAEGVERTKKAVAFLEASYAPRLRVAASLAVATDGGARSIAAGSVALLPRRWTQVWWRRELHRHVAGYSLEVAQGAVVNRPSVATVPEGGELYLRWSPGEKTSLVELYAGEYAPLPPERVDLSVIRNTPEASPMGVVELPRTSVCRLSTTLVVPAAATTFELPFGGVGPAKTLTIAVSAAPEVPAAIELGAAKFRISRLAAAAAALDGTARESGVSELVSKFQALGGADGGIRGLETTADAFVAGEAAGAELDRLRDEIVRVEGALTPLVVGLKLIRLPQDDALVGDGPGGAWIVGAPLSKAAAAAVSDPKSPSRAAIRLPVLSGVPASTRIAVSTVGFDHLSSAVAQNAAGVQPESGAWFDGLLADRLRASARDGGGAALALVGNISWVRAAAHSATLAFRTPIGLDGRTGAGSVDDPTTRRVTIPLVATGESKLDLEVGFSAAEVKDGTPIVLATLAVRDDDGKLATVLLVGTVGR